MKNEQHLHVSPHGSNTNVGRSYNFSEPKFLEKDRVWFKDNKGYELEGEIINIETHWSKDRNSYHIYTLYNKNRKRLMHVGEKSIVYRYDA